ncbi:MAG: GNAT family N-acetyltransferase [Actinobacteria bacterium]|nr:MAG: GNAT family N-acetyltransferase [Actinomycetota bacterium]
MTNLPVEIRSGAGLPLEAVVALYDSVGWAAYTRDPAGLQTALRNSTFVVTAWRDSQLIGLARAFSDDVAIAYLQDILVQPEFQRGGVGRRLVQACLERFAHVRALVLLTDDSTAQLRFYAALGFKNTRDLVRQPLNAFVRMPGLE